MRRGENHYLSNTFAHIDRKKTNQKRMTVLILSNCRALCRKQIILATMDRESENKANCFTVLENLK